MPNSNDLTLHSPRLLCLHGGGTNAQILQMQARAYIPLLSPHFRLVFADAPFPCSPHPAILPVYADCGPFRLWARWRADQAGGEGVEVERAWEESMRRAMEGDDGDGEWVGLFGFSQGAKVAGSVLFEQQLRVERAGEGAVGFAGGSWKFGVLCAGRGPWAALSDEGEQVEGLERVGEIVNVSTLRGKEGRGKLRLPTVHVLGLRDEGLPFMRQMRKFDCVEGSTRLIEWDGGHRLAFRSVDVEPVVREILKIGIELGVLDIVDLDDAMSSD